MIESISTYKQYEEARQLLNNLMVEATRKRMLAPDADNEYTRNICRLATLIADYEDNTLHILPLKERNPLIKAIEDHFHDLGMSRKDAAASL